MESKPPKKICSNCKSKRWRVHRAGFCKKCYYWHQKLMRPEKIPQAAGTTIKKENALLPKYYKRVAKRALEELAWRERCLNSDNVSAFDVEHLINAVAAECRSEVDFTLHSFLASQSPEARNCFFMILLSILENVPARTPRLRLFSPPIKGQYWKGWSEWSRSLIT